MAMKIDDEAKRTTRGRRHRASRAPGPPLITISRQNICLRRYFSPRPQPRQNISA